jgi:dynein light intermediate chain 2
LINILKASQKDEPTKPTYAMEYSFAKRNTNTRKEVVHFYEVGGGRELTNLLVTPMTRENYKYISYVIVVDLSKPSTIMESLNYWISAIREAV